jgi:CubicO group peptidase (beta-lactamase class C family)
VVHRGRIAAERYSEGITRDTRLQSWSMSKSFLHALLGLLVGDGKLDPDAPAPVPEWQAEGDPRKPITIRQLAQMVDGLDFRENYSDTNADVMQMLFGAGRGDVGKSAASVSLGHAPGTVWSYSGGSANIIARIIRDTLGGREATRAYLDERLFKPIGIRSAIPEFDASGTWIASSYIHATARDYARFGLLYLRRGFWDGRQLLTIPWAESATESAPASKGLYGTLFWLNAKDKSGKCAISDKLPCDIYFARGFGGQLIAIAPSQDAVIVMLNAAYTDDIAPIIDLMANILGAL